MEVLLAARSLRPGVVSSGSVRDELRSRLVRGRAHDLWRLIRARRAARGRGPDLDGVKTFCLFIGHARSGHSVLSGLLGAHPNAVFSDEMDAVHYVKAGFSRRDVLALSLAVAASQAQGRQKQGRDGRIYSYEVPGWWQGRYERLDVVGDSLAGRTSQALAAEPALIDRVDRLMAPADVRYIHVVRDPFDNISTMMIRGGRTFEGALERYFATCDALDSIRELIGTERILTLAHEDFVADPQQVLRQACEHLSLDVPDGYLEACSGIVYRSPSRSSARIDWDARMEAAVRERMGQHAYLERYAASGPAPGDERPAT